MQPVSLDSRRFWTESGEPLTFTAVSKPGGDGRRKALLERIGRKVAEVRTARGLNQRQLAAAVGRATNSVSRWELGAQEMGVLDAMAIARECGVTLQQLVDPLPDVPAIRDQALHFLSPDRLEKLRAARTPAELAGLLSLSPAVGVIVEPSDVLVTAEQWHATILEADQLYQKRTAGPLRRTIDKLLGKS